MSRKDEKPGKSLRDSLDEALEDWDAVFDALHEEGHFLAEEPVTRNVDVSAIRPPPAPSPSARSSELEEQANIPIELTAEPAEELEVELEFELGPAGGSEWERGTVDSFDVELGSAGGSPRRLSPNIVRRGVAPRRPVAERPREFRPPPGSTDGPEPIADPGDFTGEKIEQETRVHAISTEQLAKLRQRPAADFRATVDVPALTLHELAREARPAADFQATVDMPVEQLRSALAFEPTEDDIDSAIDDLFGWSEDEGDGGVQIEAVDAAGDDSVVLLKSPLRDPDRAATETAAARGETEETAQPFEAPSQGDLGAWDPARRGDTIDTGVEDLIVGEELVEPGLTLELDAEPPPSTGARADETLDDALAALAGIPGPRGSTEGTLAVGDETVADTPLLTLVDDYEEELSQLHTGIYAATEPMDAGDLEPELPPSPFEDKLPELALDDLAVADRVEPDMSDRTEAAARDLLMFEREIELVDEPGPLLRLRLESARLAMRITDYDHAREHYEAALEIEGRCVEAARGLRRVAQAVGDWYEALSCLDREIAVASPMERRALTAYRADLLAALGERDQAREVIAELLAQASSDPRALLLRLEIALTDDDPVAAAELLELLARTIADARLSSSLQLARTAVGGEVHASAERAFEDPAGSHARVAAGLVLAPLLAAGGQWREAAAVWSRMAEDATVQSRDPDLAGAMNARAARASARAGDPDGEWSALARATELLPYDAATHAAYARASARRHDTAATAHAYRQLAAIAPTTTDRIDALAEAARAFEAMAPDDATDAQKAREAALECHREIVRLDPNDRMSSAVLAEEAARTGDVDAQTALERARIAALADADEDGAAHARVGVAQRLLAAARYSDAADELRSAFAASPDAPWDAKSARSPVLVRLLDRSLAYAQCFDERAVLSRSLAADPPAWLAPVLALERAARTAEDALGYHLIHEESTGEERSTDGDAALEEALARWSAVLDADPESPVAHAARVSLAQRHAYRTASPEELAGALTGAREHALTDDRATALALREVAIFLGEDSDDGARRADACLDEASQRAPQDPRVALARILQAVAAESWDEIAQILVETADTAGQGMLADSRRYRAASIWLGREHDAVRAADLLGELLERRPAFAGARELLRTAKRDLGAPVPTATPASGRAPAGIGDSFAQLIRDAEDLEDRAGDPAGAVHRYRQALALRPGEPAALLGFEQAARAAGLFQELADLGLAEVKARDAGDDVGRARAYEALAIIDESLRGDRESALYSYRAAVQADPTYLPALQAVARHAMAASDLASLHDSLGRIITALGSSRDVVSLAVERARLGQLLGRPDAVVAADARTAYELDARRRMALIALESAARADGPSLERAELEVAIARYFDGDERAQAAFFTRAGETFLELGVTDAASEQFRAALDVLFDCAPALSGWCRAAILGERWNEVAAAAERSAGLAEDEHERAELLHLAAVATMDRVLDGERAAMLLREVLDLWPESGDAFARLRLLYDELHRHDDLVALLEERAGIEDDTERRLELHYAAADLYRTFFDDRDRAAHHLRAMLDLDPEHRTAISDLADIAWEQGDWSEAADALERRARVETNPSILRNIYFRLGQLYADHLPDDGAAIAAFENVLASGAGDRQALARLADLHIRAGHWDEALATCETLLKIETDPGAKIDHLHRTARIYAEGFENAGKAEKALRIALDVDPSSSRALAAIVEFYEGTGDQRGLRVNLDRVAAAMRSRLHKKPAAAVPYRILADIFERRANIGVAGSMAAAYTAVELARWLGATDPAQDELAAAAARHRPKAIGLGTTELDDYLYPRAVTPAFRDLFRLLSERVAKIIGIDLRAHGVGRGDRLAAGDPVVAIIQDVADELRVGDVEVYVSRTQPTVAVAEPTNPISVVLGETLVTPDKPQQVRFLAGRVLKPIAAGLAVPARLGPRNLGLLTAAIVRQFQPEFAVKGLDEASLASETERQRKLVPARLQQEIATCAVGVAGAGEFDPRRVAAALVESGNRAGLVCGGSVAAALSAAMAMGGYRDIHQALANDEVVHLVHFAVSEEYIVIRAALDR